MASVKEEAANTIARLPDDATWDDVLYAMYVRHEVAAGEADIAAGRTYSTEEVLRSLGLPVK
jgi:predicted transcriptional regulator